MLFPVVFADSPIFSAMAGINILVSSPLSLFCAFLTVETVALSASLWLADKCGLAKSLSSQESC